MFKKVFLTLSALIFVSANSSDQKTLPVATNLAAEFKIQYDLVITILTQGMGLKIEDIGTRLSPATKRIFNEKVSNARTLIDKAAKKKAKQALEETKAISERHAKIAKTAKDAKKAKRLGK